MREIKSVFVNQAFQTASGKAIQRLSYDRIVETRPAARESLGALLVKISKAIKGIDFDFGPDKDLGVAENKAHRDYKGDMKRVTDYVRAKITVDNVNAIRYFSSREFEHLLYENDIHIAEVNDYFSDPKDQTGYRCMNFKLAVPVGRDSKGNTEHQVVELQIVADQIEKVYDQTHVYKRRAEDAETRIFQHMRENNIYELKAKELSGERLTREEEAQLKSFDILIKPLKTISRLNYAACRLINGQASRSDNPKYDFQSLIAPEHKSKHFLYPGRESNLETMRAKADLLHNEGYGHEI